MLTVAQVGSARSPIIQNWAEYMAEQGFDTHLISEEKYEGDRLQNVKVHYIGNEDRQILAFNYLRKVSQTKRILKDIKADVAHAHYVYGYGLLLALAKFHPFVATAMGNDIGVSPIESTLINRGTRKVLKDADLISVKDELAKGRAINLGCPESKIIIQPSTFDPNIFNPMANDTSLREELSVNEAFTVFYTRRITDDYRSSVLIEAISYVQEINPDIRFVITKRGDWKEAKTSLKDYEEAVRWVEPITHPTEMARYLSTLDVLVDTYYPRYDVGGHGHGTNFVEAMACGCPQIVPDRPEFELGRSEGWCHASLYPKGNSLQLAKTIIHLAKNPKLATEIGRNSVESSSFASASTVMKEMADRYLRWYDADI